MPEETLNNTPTMEAGGLVDPGGTQRPLDAQYSDLDDAGAPSGVDAKTQDPPERDQEKDAKGKAESPPQDDDTRFDKHPRWQRLKKERDEARIMAERAKAQMELLEKQHSTPPPPAGAPQTGKLPYRDITTMTSQELSEWQTDDPKGYAANLYAQVLHEANAKAMAELDRRQAEAAKEAERKAAWQKARDTFRKFADDHADFQEMWDSGALPRYIEEHPGHNAISAYHELTAEKRIQDAVQEARKQAEAEAQKKFEAKKKAAVLGGGPSGVQTRQAQDTELENTKEKGGLTSVLAERLARMRRGQGG